MYISGVHQPLVAAALERTGWNRFTGQHPPVMSLCVGEQHVGEPIARWARDLEEAVREVERGLVLEVAFDAAQRSTRHKSGFALRFPRIARIRRDKPAAEADRVEAVAALVADGLA
jgi:hypothetical protein